MDGLEKIIGIKFKNKKLLQQALTHNSYSNEQKILYGKAVPHFERIEFLGDAVLELVITEYLFEKYPKEEEGKLTKYRSTLVKGQNLSEVARSINLGDYILLSHGEKKAKGNEKSTILENAMEALIGAIYLDQGMEVAIKFVKKFILSKIGEGIDLKFIDAKTKWQEIAQEKYAYTPKYEVIEEQGPDHNKVYTSIAIIKDISVGKGNGKSKKESELSAAADAVQRYEKYKGDLEKMRIEK
jgi:ribonuclease-3